MLANTILFRDEAIRFEKTGIYCKDPWGSPAWKLYWQEQLKRCKEGYSVGGMRVTGNHYFYLNFCKISLTSSVLLENESVVKDKKEKGFSKKSSFPDFWDGDMEYFNIVEKCEKEGKHLCLGKTRRRGYSFKSAAICANKYNTVRESLSIIGAFETKYLYPKGTMTMTNTYLNFLNASTGWAKKSQVINKVNHRKASYIENVKGIPVEKGYKSEVMAISYKDNPDSARGKDPSLVLLEEAGKFSNLKASFIATRPSVEDGIHTTGLIIIYGTGGSMESSTADFCDLFYNPEPYNIMAFENIWDEGARGTSCGFFVPDYINKVGFIDKEGNSIQDKARQYEEAKRGEISKTAKDRKTLSKYIVEYPFTPQEAFFLSTGNIFPVVDLKHRLGHVEASSRIRNADFIGELLFDEGGKVMWKENKESVYPITEFPLKAGNPCEGGIVIFSHPYTDENGHTPPNLYISGVDPYDHDASQTGSLGSTLVYDRLNKKIVAEYTGRPPTSKEYYENVRRLLLYYNSKALYENERKGMFDYFEYKSSLHLLYDEPEIIHDIIQDSKVTRKKGMHMTKPLKEYGEEMVNSWLIEKRQDEPFGTENNLFNLHLLRSIPLLKELIAYNSDGNFDRVIAMILIMYYEADIRKQKAELAKRPIKTVMDDPFWSRGLFKKPVNYESSLFL